MFLTDTDVSLSFCLPLSLESMKSISSSEDLKKKQNKNYIIGREYPYDDGFLGSVIPLSYHYQMAFYLPDKIKEQPQYQGRTWYYRLSLA